MRNSQGLVVELEAQVPPRVIAEDLFVGTRVSPELVVDVGPVGAKACFERPGLWRLKASL